MAVESWGYIGIPSQMSINENLKNRVKLLEQEIKELREPKRTKEEVDDGIYTESNIRAIKEAEERYFRKERQRQAANNRHSNNFQLRGNSGPRTNGRNWIDHCSL